MKRSLVLTSALLAAGLCAAQEEGLVISSTPVVQQVGVPRQVCTSEPVTVQPPKSGAGAAIGAVAGGIVGNAATQGSGAATVLGAIGGAVIGNQIEQPPPPVTQHLTRCAVQTVYENRTMYDVEYEYGGKRYKVLLPYDPGQTIALRVAPEQLGEPNAPPPAPIVSTPPVYTPPVVVAPGPVYYPYYYPYGYYPAPAVGVQLHFGSYWRPYPYYAPRYVPRYYAPPPAPHREPPHLGR